MIKFLSWLLRATTTKMPFWVSLDTKDQQTLRPDKTPQQTSNRPLVWDQSLILSISAPKISISLQIVLWEWSMQLSCLRQEKEISKIHRRIWVFFVSLVKQVTNHHTLCLLSTIMFINAIKSNTVPKKEKISTSVKDAKLAIPSISRMTRSSETVVF